MRGCRPGSILAILVAGFAQAQTAGVTVDELLARYAEARGGQAALDGVQAVRAQGTAVFAPGMERPFRYEWRRPNQIRFELTFQGLTEVQAFDGETAWFVDPPDVPEPTPMPAEQLAMLNDGVDFLGPLVDPAEKGHRIELAGRKEVEGTPAFKLVITKGDGMVEHTYLDAEYFLEILQVEKYDLHGTAVEMEVTWSDYKEVGGVLLPHSWNRRPRGGGTGLTLMFEGFELNPELPDSRFREP